MSSADDRPAAEPPVPTNPGAGSTEWERVSRTPAFRELMRRKRAFVLPAVISFTTFYLAWPVLGGFTTVLDRRAIGEMPWAYVYGFAQFVMMLVLLHLYRRQAVVWDELSQRARIEARDGTAIA